VIHAAVVFTPLACLAALAWVFLPRYRHMLLWPTLALVVIASGAIWAAYLTGNNFFSDPRFSAFSGEILDRIHKHQSYAKTLRWIATGFAAVTLAAIYLRDRSGTLLTVLNGLVVVGAIATLVWVFLTGDAGARAVWS
jgi:hypothetical protein